MGSAGTGPVSRHIPCFVCLLILFLELVWAGIPWEESVCPQGPGQGLCLLLTLPKAW